MVKNPPVSAGNVSSVPGLGRSPGEGNGNTLQYSRLESPMDRGAWWATVHGVTKESEMKKTRKQDSPLEPPEKIQPCQQLDFSPKIFISDFLPKAIVR